jgi:hypothetical protein
VFGKVKADNTEKSLLDKVIIALDLLLETINRLIYPRDFSKEKSRISLILSSNRVVPDIFRALKVFRLIA